MDDFIINSNLPEDVKRRWFNKKLTIEDLISYQEIFKNLEDQNYLNNNLKLFSNFIINNYGKDAFFSLIQKHQDLLEHIDKLDFLLGFVKLMEDNQTPDLEKTFTRAVKEYFIKYDMPLNFRTIRNGVTQYNVPNWLFSMNFKFAEALNAREQLLQYHDSIFILHDNQRKIIDTFNINNIKRFEEETGFFSYKESYLLPNLINLNVIGNYLTLKSESSLANKGINFQKGNLNYQEFLDMFAKLLDDMRMNHAFSNQVNYDVIQGDFRENHSEIFMDIRAPKKLRDAFYSGNLDLELIYKHKDYINYLVGKNLGNSLDKTKLLLKDSLDSDDVIVYDFLKEYIKRYGSLQFLRLCAKYGPGLYDIEIESLNNEIENEDTIQKAIRKALFKKFNSVYSGSITYDYLASIPEFWLEYPTFFVNFDDLKTLSLDDKTILEDAFYKGYFNSETIKRYPEVINILKDKDLRHAFKSCNLDLLKKIGNEKFLILSIKYGIYLDKVGYFVSEVINKNNGKDLSIKDLDKIVEEVICKEALEGTISYNYGDIPSFLKEKCPELFLDDDAPEDLKKYFYSDYVNFEVLKRRKSWLPYLKNKALKTSLIRSASFEEKDDLRKFFELFGEEKAIKLGINKTETVLEMIYAHQVPLMKEWYDKTGGKFIPDFVVMQNFALEEADKFLTSGHYWSKLMKIIKFAKEAEMRDAMLKLAYSFGVFDNNEKGFQELFNLLTEIPKRLTIEQGYILDKIDKDITECTLQKQFYHGDDIDTEVAYKQMMSYIKDNNYLDMYDDNNILYDLLDSLKKEKVNIDFAKDIFKQIYRKNEDNTYTLSINLQKYPKTTEAIRTILEYYDNNRSFKILSLLKPVVIHQIFGGFILQYDPLFQKFLVNNLDRILNNPIYITYLANIQRQFANIRTANSNRVLTLELALSYVQENRYSNIEVGNEKLAEVCAIAGYSQADFDVLQEIYNFGKQRVFSSIPKIENKLQKKTGKYNYEMLDLDNPLALVIGTLTDCCQKLHDYAEGCMEHSMVSDDGRIFLITDDEGNIMAQSWVWRNKDVLCFDNIEVPNKAFIRFSKKYPNMTRRDFTKDIFDIYKKAAQELILKDNLKYQELLAQAKITKEEYDCLYLKKITVGLGFNDIAEAIEENAQRDIEVPLKPLPFRPPVPLAKGLYINDSRTQYILEEKDNPRDYEGSTLTIYNDNYRQYTDYNFNKKLLTTLQRLEMVTKKGDESLKIIISNKEELLVTQIANNYGFNPDLTKIILHPNFAIIYEEDKDAVRIGDLFFNIVVNTNKNPMNIEDTLVKQINLALGQIGKNKNFDISFLNEEQREIYLKAQSLIEERILEKNVTR